ncbi:hypothetical protein PTT_20165 [Pyrenophora teres f. teres 0-1]|uniref:Transmembrane protein n=2 Tax=Pyrenophora TaxID=5027 RepID=E3SAG4_PYRTT|nr:uncharacterized protein PTRG_09762 [Pyrenophora tritici-repentis Pt-1C-BFP]EDU42813.1 conserved hypothetical protein [Pyrenophora tritici-repentis Pt-1C-BFP]EFQ85035.1 hypothetical protein PTT_20165 [Pyrenophora teres f. teres 0-1]
MSSNTLSASAISTPPSRRPATPPHFDAVIRTETVCNTSNAKRQRLKKHISYNVRVFSALANFFFVVATSYHFSV